MTSPNGNIFHITGPLWGESTGHRWVPLTKASAQTLIFSLICAWTNGWSNNLDAGNFRRHRPRYDVTVIYNWKTWGTMQSSVMDVFLVDKNMTGCGITYIILPLSDKWRHLVYTVLTDRANNSSSLWRLFAFFFILKHITTSMICIKMMTNIFGVGQEKRRISLHLIMRLFYSIRLLVMWKYEQGMLHFYYARNSHALPLSGDIHVVEKGRR